MDGRGQIPRGGAGKLGWTQIVKNTEIKGFRERGVGPSAGLGFRTLVLELSVSGRMRRQGDTGQGILCSAAHLSG